MTKQLRPLDFLPWRSLFQAALLTAMIVVLLEFILLIITQQIPDFAAFINRTLASSLDILLLAATGVGTGALAVFILDRIGCPGITSSTLWGLVACIFLIFLPRRLLPLPALIFDIDPIHVITMIVGVFWKGRPYWR
jgi:hypothetical protein